MRPEPLLRIGLAALACTTLLLGLSSQPAGAQTAGSGFLSDYARLGKAGPVRDRYLSYTDPELTGRPIRTLCILPVRRFPADARFDGVDDALADDLLARADAQLRASSRSPKARQRSTWFRCAWSPDRSRTRRWARRWRRLRRSNFV